MPAVLDSRCFAASLGYLQWEMRCSSISENLEPLEGRACLRHKKHGGQRACVWLDLYVFMGSSPREVVPLSPGS